MMIIKTYSKGNKFISLAVALGFILLGLVILFLPKLKHLDCTEPVEATVVRVNTQKKPGHLTNEWPIYEYEYNGTTMQYESEFPGSNSSYEIGDTEALYINPENPDRVYEPNNKINLRNSLLMIGAGLLCLVFFIMNLLPKRGARKED